MIEGPCLPMQSGHPLRKGNLREYLVQAKKAVTLLEQWMKDQVIYLSFTYHSPFTGDLKVANCCLYHRRKGHPLEQCIIFRRLFDKKLKAGKILLHEGGATNIHELPFQAPMPGQRPSDDGLTLGSRSRESDIWGRARSRENGSTATKWLSSLGTSMTR